MVFDEGKYVINLEWSSFVSFIALQGLKKNQQLCRKICSAYPTCALSHRPSIASALFPILLWLIPQTSCPQPLLYPTIDFTLKKLSHSPGPSVHSTTFKRAILSLLNPIQLACTCFCPLNNPLTCYPQPSALYTTILCLLLSTRRPSNLLSSALWTHPSRASSLFMLLFTQQPSNLLSSALCTLSN